MLRSVIFDLDGLLVDSETVIYHIYCDILRPYGYDFPLTHYAEKYCGRTLLRNMKDITSEYVLPIDAEECLRQYTEIENGYIRRGIPLKKGAMELLTYLKARGCMVSLASSSIEERALSILSRNHTVGFFDRFTYGPEVSNGKPAPDIFLRALEKTGITPGETLILEDSEAGVQAAEAAHIPVICVPDMVRPSSEVLQKAVGVFDSLLQVMEWSKRN